MGGVSGAQRAPLSRGIKMGWFVLHGTSLAIFSHLLLLSQQKSQSLPRDRESAKEPSVFLGLMRVVVLTPVLILILLSGENAALYAVFIWLSKSFTTHLFYLN